MSSPWTHTRCTGAAIYTGRLALTVRRVNLRQSVDRSWASYFDKPRLDARIPTLLLPAELARRVERSTGPSPADGYVTVSAQVVKPDE